MLHLYTVVTVPPAHSDHSVTCTEWLLRHLHTLVIVSPVLYVTCTLWSYFSVLPVHDGHGVTGTKLLVSPEHDVNVLLLHSGHSVTCGHSGHCFTCTQW